MDVAYRGIGSSVIARPAMLLLQVSRAIVTHLFAGDVSIVRSKLISSESSRKK
jgi:hypothetical protein